MRTLLFLHGLNWSGDCPMAQTLRAELADTVKVNAPDIPVNPNEAKAMLLELCDEIQPDLIVGSSYGAFLGQQLIKIDTRPYTANEAIGCVPRRCSLSVSPATAKPSPASQSSKKQFLGLFAGYFLNAEFENHDIVDEAFDFGCGINAGRIFVGEKFQSRHWCLVSGFSLSRSCQAVDGTDVFYDSYQFKSYYRANQR